MLTSSHRKTTSGMKPDLVSAYTFSDQGWNRPGDPRFNDVFGYLAQRLCMVGDTYYIKHPSKHVWESIASKTAAIARVYQEHAGTVTINGVQKVVSLDDIKVFCTIGIVSFANVIYAPLQPDFLWFANERRLNVYRDTRIDGIVEHIDSAEEFLRILRNGLCNATDELDVLAMIGEATGKDQTPFRWLIHWLAARYQLPGYTSQTNLWFCGARGTGKGSLLSVLRVVFGGKAVGKIDSSDINRGWSNSLFGADIIEWDEFKSGGWHDLNRFIKEKTGNETYTVTARNIGGTEQPFVAGQIMTTNDAHPMFVEEDDRQNSFIKTTSDPAWKARAKALWSSDTNALLDPCIPFGFAALLNLIEIDFDFIRRPLNTALRDDLVDYFKNDSVEQWIEHDGQTGYDHPSWDELHRSYKTFTLSHANGKPKDLKTFKKYLVENKLAKEDFAKIKVGGLRKTKRYARLFATTPLAEVV